MGTWGSQQVQVKTFKYIKRKGEYGEGLQIQRKHVGRLIKLCKNVGNSETLCNGLGRIDNMGRPYCPIITWERL